MLEFARSAADRVRRMRKLFNTLEFILIEIHQSQHDSQIRVILKDCNGFLIDSRSRSIV